MTHDSNALLERAVRTASVTRAVAVARGAISQMPRLLTAIGVPRACLIVADGATMQAAGHATAAALRTAGVAVLSPVVLDETPRVKPRIERARDLGARFATMDALPIAVGAGVINDVTKCAAGMAGIPYVSVATAASMDGYAASGAAMLDDGFKRTFACPPPVAIAADLDVIAKAPARMAAWGYGDLAGKLIAGADWILADAVGEDPLDAVPFALVQSHVKDWLASPAAIAAHDTGVLRGLVDGLLISGFAMQARGDSRPASGSEHQLSHLWEMDRIEVDGEPAAHGACVGVATVAMLALYEWMLAQEPIGAPTESPARTAEARAVESELREAFAEPTLVDSVRVEMMAKLGRAEHRRARVDRLVAAWPQLRARLRETLVPAATMEQWLTDARAARHPRDLGIPLAQLARDYRRARLIRRRYTILDCLDDLGWLDAAIAALFMPGGFWACRSDRR